MTASDRPDDRSGRTPTDPGTLLGSVAATSLLCAGLLLAVGCTPPVDSIEASPASATRLEDLEVVLGAPLELAPVHARVERVAREPMMVEHPSGAWFVTGYGSQDPQNSSPQQPPSLWRSNDQGTTWSAVDVGGPDDGAYGNSDVDLSVGPEGNLYFIVMGFDRSTFRGTHVTVGASTDIGETWTWTVLSETELDDRPWVRATPDGRVHAIWNDGEGVAYARSNDGGVTWSEQPRLHSAGGSSHLAVGPAGQIAVRIGPMSASGHRNHPGEDWIAVSTDGGDNWTRHAPPGDGQWPTSIAELGTNPRWVDPLAWSASGDLLHAWTTDMGLHIARSENQGATWTTWRLAEPAPESSFFFPYLTGGFDITRGTAAGTTPPDTYAVSWFIGSATGLQAQVARLTFGSDALTVERTEPFSLPIRRRIPNADEESWAPDTGGEYFPAIVSRDGRIVAATTIQGDPDGDGFTVWVESR